MTGQQAVFRCDGGVDIGAGHLARCLTMANALADTGWSCRFLVNFDAGRVFPHLLNSRHALVYLAESERYTAAPVVAQGGDLLVIDHYGLGAAFEKACRAEFTVVMAIDDPPCRPHDCNILLNQNAGPNFEDISGPRVERYLAGSQYTMLAPEFIRHRQKVLENRCPAGDVKRIFISFGSSDPTDMCGRTVRAILDMGTTAAIDIAVSAASPNADALRQLAMAAPSALTLHFDTGDIPALMATADIAVGAAGTMTWERCCFGLPSIVYICADNQVAIADVVAQAGAAIVLGRSEDFEGPALTTTATALIADSGRREVMAAQAATLCDGDGSSRVVREVTTLLGNDTNRPLVLH